MTLRLTFGIDPGLSGAVATLVDGEPGPILDMPVADFGKGREVDAFRLADFVRQQRAAHPGASFAAVVERIQARPMRDANGNPQEGGKARNSLAEGFGQLKATFRVLGVPLAIVEPAVWKRHMGLLKQGKDASRVLALRRFPSVAPHLARKKDNGRSDALLIALWYENTKLGAIAA